ncbi:MAG: 3-deoxy-7-phosphoheptulonate synthase class II [Actinomycetota bacterium]
MTVDLERWRTLPATQQPEWPDEAVLRSVADQLAKVPPLVFAGECRTLTQRLAAVARGEAFLLQGGDCAETFAAFDANQIRDKLKTLLQMAIVLTYAAAVPVVKVGRIAGQFAKPRSSATELYDGEPLASYRGDSVNDLARTKEARTPDPHRMLRAYNQAASTLNLLRAYATGGFADLHRVHAWNKDFVKRSSAGERYEQLAHEIDRALGFMAACGINVANTPAAHEIELYVSHEALLLEYERALVRRDDSTGDIVGTSGHMLWVGERTREPDGAHVELLSQVSNPLGVKLGPTTTGKDALRLAERLNPDGVPGRLTFITRFGAGKVRDGLPPVVEAVRDAEIPVVWTCDPMHGNTFEASNGYKTRSFDRVLDEVRGFFEVHRALGTWPGGVHIELTGDDVTECVGGAENISEADLAGRYETACDPRLNTSQSLELAFMVAEMLQQH